DIRDYSAYGCGILLLIKRNAVLLNRDLRKRIASSAEKRCDAGGKTVAHARNIFDYRQSGEKQQNDRNRQQGEALPHASGRFEGSRFAHVTSESEHLNVSGGRQIELFRGGGVIGVELRHDFGYRRVLVARLGSRLRRRLHAHIGLK